MMNFWRTLYVPAQSSSDQLSRRRWLQTVGVATIATAASLVNPGEALAQFPTSADIHPELVPSFMMKQFFRPLGSLKTTDLSPKERLIATLEIANKAFKQITKVYPGPKYINRQRKALEALKEAVNMHTQDLMRSLEIQTITDLGYLYNSVFINNLDNSNHSIESLAAEWSLKPSKVNLFIKGVLGKPVNPETIPSVTKLLAPLAKTFSAVEVFVIDDSSFSNWGLTEGLKIVVNKARIQKAAELLEISYEEAEKLTIANEAMHVSLKLALNPRTFDETFKEPLIVKDIIPGLTFHLNRQANEFLSDVASVNEQPRDIVRILGFELLGKQHGYCTTREFARKITDEFCDEQGIKKLDYNQFDGCFKTLKQYFNTEDLLQKYLSYVSKHYTEAGANIVASIKANQEQLPLRISKRVLPAQ